MLTGIDGCGGRDKQERECQLLGYYHTDFYGVFNCVEITPERIDRNEPWNCHRVRARASPEPHANRRVSPQRRA